VHIPSLPSCKADVSPSAAWALHQSSQRPSRKMTFMESKWLQIKTSTSTLAIKEHAALCTEPHFATNIHSSYIHQEGQCLLQRAFSYCNPWSGSSNVITSVFLAHTEHLHHFKLLKMDCWQQGQLSKTWSHTHIYYSSYCDVYLGQIVQHGPASP